MSIIQCQTCGYVIIDPSRPCSSCGNINAQPSTLSFQAPVLHGDASMFSVGIVMGRSFLTMFKHPLVFVGLSFLALIPGLVITVLMRDSAVKNAATSIINTVFGLVIQGSIAYGVFEALRGNATRFGKSLSRGMEHVISLIFSVLLLAVLSVLPFMIGEVVASVLGRGGAALGTAALLFTLWCCYCVFAPICVVERLGPLNSLNRSMELTKRCRWKIAGIYLLCLIIISGTFIVFTYLTVLFSLFFAVIFGPVFALIFSAVLLLVVIAVPTAFFHITTAVIYYELRSVKEGVDIDQLASVFD